VYLRAKEQKTLLYRHLLKHYRTSVISKAMI